MPDYPPFMNAYGLISKILAKIKEASTPDRFTQDFLGTKLGFGSGSAKAFIPFAKRIGLLGSDGAPTDLYKSFRNPTHSGHAIAKAMKTGYKDLFSRNEYAHDLDRKKLEGLVIEATGLKSNQKTLRAICSSFEALKSLAKFDKEHGPPKKEAEQAHEEPAGQDQHYDGGETRFGLSYVINLVLPNTNDVAVFNAIFKSLRENLLR